MRLCLTPSAVQRSRKAVDTKAEPLSVITRSTRIFCRANHDTALLRNAQAASLRSSARTSTYESRDASSTATYTNSKPCFFDPKDRFRVMTDNGSAFVSTAFRERCTALGVKHKRIRPYTPRTNGKAERFIQTLLREWAYRFTYESSAERQRWLRPIYISTTTTGLIQRSATIHQLVAWIGTTS